jgi:hypothetical protein
MGQAVGGILRLAIAVDISVLSIIAVILMLITSRARSNGPAFVAGWVLGLVVVGGLVLIIANTANVASSSGLSTAAYAIKLTLGVLLLLLASGSGAAGPRRMSRPRRRSGWRPWTASPRSNRSAWVRQCRG